MYDKNFVKVPLLVVKAQAKRANSKSNVRNYFDFSNKKNQYIEFTVFP